MNDPTAANPVPAWGHVGQQSGCQSNLEVADPLTFTDIPTVTMSNGYTYHLQELADFSWFFRCSKKAVIDPKGVASGTLEPRTWSRTRFRLLVKTGEIEEFEVICDVWLGVALLKPSKIW